MDLFVRAGRTDNRVLDELVAPATAGMPFGGRRVPMRALVLDAPTAAGQPGLRDSALSAGLPLLIDPLTYLFQDQQPAGSGWASLGFADFRSFSPGEFTSDAELDNLIHRTLSFQLDHGASVLIPPYFHAKSPDDPWFQVQLAVNRRTTAYLRSEGINVPTAPVLAGSLRGFGSRASWAAGVDTFVRSLSNLNVRYVPLALSSSRAQRGDTEDRLGAYLATVHHVAGTADIIAWRQGQYGLASVAAGAIGYQTGLGTDERCDLPALGRARRPKLKKSSPRMPKRIYVGRFGRSLSSTAVEALIATGYLRGALACTDATCCPDGTSSMLTDWRQHAVRSRARELDDIRAMPNAAWRLNHVARQAERAADDARAANEVLENAEIAERVPEASFRALTAVLDAIREVGVPRAG